mmetsp:Transcript_30779/g.86265  ORF Transcript_30779/g.86265 Transcript_30779/m.86265 type:complete len:134 (+) Transcript_30779:61-462(+)
MVRIDYYLSRIVHLGSAAVLASAVLAPYMFQDGTLRNPMVMPIAAVLAGFSGLYNAGAVKPSRMGNQALPWRIITYGVKVAAFLAMTPLLNKVLEGEAIHHFRLGATVVSLMAASYARYYREEHSFVAKQALN